MPTPQAFVIYSFCRAILILVAEYTKFKKKTLSELHLIPNYISYRTTFVYYEPKFNNIGRMKPIFTSRQRSAATPCGRKWDEAMHEY